MPATGGASREAQDKMEKALEEALLKQAEEMQRLAKREQLEFYSHLRNERDKATFTLMMKMNPRALSNMRKEWFLREDALQLEEFLYVVNKHLIRTDGGDEFVMDTPEDREFGTQMFELFKDIDVNGDGDLEWQEFTTFVVEKANLLNKRQKLATIPHYHESTRSLDPSAEYRHRNDISKIVSIPYLHQFCMAEDTKRSIWVFNSKKGKHIATIATDAAPIALAALEPTRGTLVASFADMTIGTYNLDEPSLTRRYQQVNAFATPGVQMALSYAPVHSLLYSGATNGDVYSWKMEDRKMVQTLQGHTDIVMSLCLFDKLNYLASGSLDKTISLWDTYTDQRIVHYQGHKKGILELAYTSDYRLLFSCGFEPDCLVWSPFVNNCVYRLKGHHGAVVGVQCVPNTPEVITADVTGTFKLWDVRKFECVQTWVANLAGTDATSDADDKQSHLCGFVHTVLPPRNSMQHEDDSRIIAASKLVFSFDQARVVHQATTDYFNILFIFWVPESCCFITVSERNVIVWDALIGCKNTINEAIMEGEEITAACLDDRKRKMVIGSAKGQVSIYNHLNGQFMKSTSGTPNPFPVIRLEYLEETRRVVAAYSNGMVRVYDENAMEDCCVIRTLGASLALHPELTAMAFNTLDRTMVTAGANMACFWNYDASKVEYELPVCSSKEAVVCIRLLLPLPVIVTSDSTGNITLWGSRGSALHQGMRMGAFLHQTVLDAETEPRPPRSNKEEAPIVRTLPPAYERDDFSLENPADEAAGAGGEADDDESKASWEKEPESDEDKGDKAPAHTLKRKKDPNEYDPVLIDEQARRASEALAGHAAEKAERKWGRVLPASTVAWLPERQCLVTGDDLGTLRCFDVSHFLQDCFACHLNPDYKGEEVRRLCAQRGRNKASALAPLSEPRPGASPTRPRYQVADLNDANAYHGVAFVWALESAHTDRVVAIEATEKGVLSSGADKLVRMWTFDGVAIGVLLQSVPTGQPSQRWALDHDVTGIIAREEAELDELISEVQVLAGPETAKPNIWEADCAGMEPGPGSADYTRSELRQRIDQTSQNLGLEFPVEEDQHEDDDDEGGGGVGAERRGSGAGEQQQGAVKLLGSALRELRSTQDLDAAHAEPSRRKPILSEVAQRRQEKKFEDISLKYEPIAGVKIVAGQTSFGGRDDDQHLDEILSITKTRSSLDVASINDMYSMNSSVGPDVVDMILRTQRSAGSKLNQEIDKAGRRGVRSMAIAKKCKQFPSFRGLEQSLVDDPMVLLGRPKKVDPAGRLKTSRKMEFLLGKADQADEGKGAGRGK